MAQIIRGLLCGFVYLLVCSYVWIGVPKLAAGHDHRHFLLSLCTSALPLDLFVPLLQCPVDA